VWSAPAGRAAPDLHGSPIRSRHVDRVDPRRQPGTVQGVDVRIGVTQAPREITVEVDDEARDDVKARVEAALSGATDVLWITDRRGRDIGIPSGKIAYVEVGSADGARRIGFGG
jgi:hypothetical protein